MVNRISNVITDTRKDIRVNEKRDIIWQIPNTAFKGKARVRNISASGMLLEAGNGFDPSGEHTVSFDTNLGGDNFIPSQGKIVWTKRKNQNQGKYFWGVKFVDPSESVISKLKHRIQEKEKSSRWARIISNIFGVGLVVSMAALLGYILLTGGDVFNNMDSTIKTSLVTIDKQAALTRTYSDKYHVTQVKLDETTAELENMRNLYALSEQMLLNTSRELALTKSILAEAETMLVAATGMPMPEGRMSELERIRTQTQAFMETKLGLENKIAELEIQNVQLAAELETLKSKIKYYEGDVKNINQSKELMSFYRDKLKLVKSKVNQFKRDAEVVRRSAQAEKDRLKAALGNKGYFTRDGQTVKVDQAKYNAVTVDSILKSENTRDDSNVLINVDFVD